MNKHICIHGHFHRPPRENPWLESVELRDPAAPCHDWNGRITWECYAPNARARLRDGDGSIGRIASNYSRMSVNFGPTRLSWLKEKMPEIHDAIVDADKKSRDRFSGHGSAPAPAHNHTIRPMNVNMWKPQNSGDQLAAIKLTEMKSRTNDRLRTWVETFLGLGRQLGFHIQDH